MLQTESMRKSKYLDRQCGNCQHEEISEVRDCGDFWNISMVGAGCFSIPMEHGVAPKVGDEILLYGRGFGYPIRGVDLLRDGETIPVYYRTEEQEAERHKQEVQEKNERQKQEFENKRSEYDAQYDALPDCFKDRIDRFRAHNEDFRWKFEPYELFCCTEAVKLIRVTEEKDSWDQFKEMDSFSDALEEYCPDLDYGEHSGNTMGCTIGLAKMYFEDPAYIVWAHGAMTPLVGCEEYGCPSPKNTEWRPSRTPMMGEAPSVVTPDMDDSTKDDE